MFIYLANVKLVSFAVKFFFDFSCCCRLIKAKLINAFVKEQWFDYFLPPKSATQADCQK